MKSNSGIKECEWFCTIAGLTINYDVNGKEASDEEVLR